MFSAFPLALALAFKLAFACEGKGKGGKALDTYSRVLVPESHIDHLLDVGLVHGPGLDEVVLERLSLPSFEEG